MSTPTGDDDRDGSADSVFETVRHPLRMRMLEVVGLSRPTPRLVRVTLAGADLAGFVSASPSDHVKLFVPDPGERVAVVPELGPHGIVPDPSRPRPVGRDYTPKHAQLDDGRLELDIVLHPGGRAATWAETAQLGDVLGVAGPRGSRVLRRPADRFVLCADETGLPAVLNHLLAARPAQHVTAVVSVAEAAEMQPLESRAELDVHWIDRSSTPDPTAAMVDLLAALPPPGRNTVVFGGGEASLIAAVRDVVRERWVVPPAWIDARGYWKLGTADHQEPHED